MTRRRPPRRVAAPIVIVLASLVAAACADRPSDPLAPAARAVSARPDPADVRAAMLAQERHTPALLRVPGVVGTAVGQRSDGQAVIRIFLAHKSVRGLPADLDGVPVAVQVTGQFVALSDPTTRQRPAPVGFSLGHPNITAGTIGARVVDGAGNVFALSNNHVLANANAASIGDPALQPGPYDGGTLADQIGTLAAFQPIDFSARGSNTMDAAIALSSTAVLSNATPADDGYGVPSAAVYGDGDGDGFFDDPTALLGLAVQKYGRTTKHTTGQITGINATVTVCYEAFIFCITSAKFVDQLIIEPGTFSGGGDSGSLIVSADATANPVGLLFAGSSTQTIANRIDLVLDHFGVMVDAGATPPPGPLTDVAIAGVSAPTAVTQGATAEVAVTVRNVGNQDVGAITVTLRDDTEDVEIGSQTIAGLAAGVTTTRTFAWNTEGATTGNHTLGARHDLSDDNPTNDAGSATVAVDAPGTGSGLHIGDLDPISMNGGSSWTAIADITVHDAGHNPVNGAIVEGAWSYSGLSADVCITGELGGNGSCIVTLFSLRRGVKSVTFQVTSVTALDGSTYVPAANHDPDGDSDGTSVTVNRP